MSWVLTREDDEDFSMTFDTVDDLVSYMHSVDSDTEISWHSEEQ